VEAFARKDKSLAQLIEIRDFGRITAEALGWSVRVIPA
jgi:hypothetical protein